MIGYLNGNVKFFFGDEIILDVVGVGYKVFTDEFTRQNLQLNAAAELFIHTAVREDAITLYGFKNRETLEFFETLLTVSGVGAKSALAIVSKISAEDFFKAINAQNLSALTKLPGIGKKSAQRILLELKDKAKNFSAESADEDFKPAKILSNAFDEATDALSALGYTSAEISAVFKRAPKNFSTEQLIKFALKELNRFA
ncbi:MAG: Holliday junction branch migration protein RuvA [Selenomonadaceae bacterium]|nr:Holliday junction branch migration protein RuvA [Selenomonadaceae bacterium]